MSAHCEIVPTDDQVCTLVGKIVLPTLNQVAKDLGRNVKMISSIMIEDEVVKILLPIVAGKADAPELNGEMRFRFRNAFGGRLLMYCECIFQKTQSVSSCSGFSLKGELKGDAHKRTSWTMRYSVWEWVGMGGNGWEWVGMGGNGWEWVGMGGNGWEWVGWV